MVHFRWVLCPKWGQRHDLNELVPCISFESYEKLLGTGAANKAQLLKMQPLSQAFAYPNIEKVTEAYDPKVLKYGVADRTLIDGGFVGDVVLAGA